MAFTDRLTTSISAGGVSLRETKSFTNTGRLGFSEVIAAATSDVAIAVTIDISALSYLAIQAVGGDVTIKTNSTATPGDTLTLPDGALVLYNSDQAALFPLFLSVDVTTMYVTNAGAAEVTVECVGLQDATPA